MTLGEKQELFAEKEAEWVLWITNQTLHPGWRLRQGEGRILIKGPRGLGRKAHKIGTDQIVMVVDLVHKENGAHPNGLAKDWQLFVNGIHITRSDDPAWVECGEKWESMHELCRWGGRFSNPDGNHISMEHGGVA